MEVQRSFPEMGLERSLSKRRTPKIVLHAKTIMVNDMIYTLVKAKENLLNLVKSIRFNEPI